MVFLVVLMGRLLAGVGVGVRVTAGVGRCIRYGSDAVGARWPMVPTRVPTACDNTIMRSASCPVRSAPPWILLRGRPCVEDARMTSSDLPARLARRLRWHQALHDPDADPRIVSHWLAELRRWQSARLRSSFMRFLDDPGRAPAAGFFLDDVYGDRDFSRRDADIVRVMPTMRRLLPAALLETVSDAIELVALSQALDLRMVEALQALAPRRRRLDDALYARAYARVGRAGLRRRQVRLVARVGRGFAAALKMRGVAALMAFSRGPARLAGLTQLQGFLERGHAAFAALPDAEAFVAEIERDELEVSRRLFAGHPTPYALGR
ncbi:MAG: hypothetical protein ABW163_03630 [Luteimonas sp.]